MACRQVHRVARLLFAVALAAASLNSAQACMMNEAYEPDKPFYEIYFGGAKVIFRGKAIKYRYPEGYLNNPTIFGSRAEITFSVTETYQGEERDVWTALWITTAFPKPIDLLAFKQEIGDDLVIVLDEARIIAGEPGDYIIVAHQMCGQPGMRSYAVMEPVLRERGLID